MSMQCNSAVRLIGPTRNTSKSPSMNENPSTVGLPIRHHQHSRQSTPRDKKSGSDETKQSAGKKKRLTCATGVVEEAILPGSAYEQMIARTWMKSEQSRPVLLTVIFLVWIGAMTPSRPSTQ